MQEPAAGQDRFIYQRSLPRRRFALLYAASVMLILILVLIVVKLPLGNQPAAIVGFPVAMLTITALMFVLLVLVAPEVPATREQALEMRLSLVCDPAVGVDPNDGRLLGMNDLAVELFGPREEFVGERVGKLAGDASSHDITDEALAFTSPDYAQMGHFTMRLATGEVRELPVIARLGNIANHDAVVLVFRADEVDRALAGFARVQERLMSNISHELRTPLNVVMGFSELLAAGTLGEMGERQLDGVSEIHTGGRRMLNIVDDVLDIGRARNYGMELEVATLDVGELITRVQDLVSGTARREKVGLEVAPDDDLPAVNADERTFKQLVYHLLLTAIDRSNTGATVRLAVTAAEDEVEVRVTSTGQALSSDEIATLEAPPPHLPLGADGLPSVLGVDLCVGLAVKLGVALEHSSSKGSVALSFALPVA